MKNSTRLLLLFMLPALTAFAGNGNRQQPQVAAIPQFVHSVQAMQIIWSEDFAGGLPSGWEANDNAGNGVNWKYTTTGIFNSTSYPGYDSLSPTGTTASNGYMLLDSDSSGGSVGGEDADLISELIDCSANSNVHLSFNELLYHYNDSCVVSVSTDGATWTDAFTASAGLGQHQSTTNPFFVDLDISSIAANQDTVYIRFNWKADYSYFWMIDDVTLYEQVGIDAVASSVISPVTTCTLLGAAEQITVGIYNDGGEDMSGFDVTYIVDGGTPVTENVTDTVSPGETLQYSFTATADLSAAGDHTIQFYVVAASDTNQANDTVNAMLFNGPHPVNASNDFTNGFEISDDLTGWMTEDLNGDSVSWELSNIFPHTGTMCARISAPTADDYFFTTCLDLVDSVQYDLEYFYRNTSTSTQSNFEIVIGQAQNSTAMTQTIVPFSLITNLGWLPNLAQFTVPAAGTYYIGFHVVNGDSATGFRLDDINLTVAGGSGITEMGDEVISVYPNPTAGMVKINSNMTGEFNVIVSNTIGQIVFSTNYQNLNNRLLDLSAQPNGQYFIQVMSENSVRTIPVTVSR